jgi:hypothetical protein
VRRHAFAAVTAVLLLGSCGDDGGSADTSVGPSFDEEAARAAVDRVYPGSPDVEALVMQAEADCTNLDREFAFQVKVLAAVGSEFLEIIHAGCPERLDQVLAEVDAGS